MIEWSSSWGANHRIQESQLEVLPVKRRIPSFRPLASTAHDGVGATEPASLDVADVFHHCIDAFTRATNWGVVPIESTRQYPCRLVDNIVTEGSDDAGFWEDLPQVTMERAQGLLRAIEGVVARLERTERALADREAELATQVLMANCWSGVGELSARMRGVLESTARSIGAVAAAVYLLDEGTRHLKMRACFGLPTSRLVQPARDLRSSMADLESLLGNAVLLNDLHAAQEWYSPEAYRSAIVVPIGTETMPHGTLWFWSDHVRSYQPHEIEVANLAAGRLMSEIEHALLGGEAVEGRKLIKWVVEGGESFSSMLPDCQVLHEDYDLGGWSQQQGAMGGAFHHWGLTTEGKLLVGAGAAQSNQVGGGVVAASALALLRALGDRGEALKQIFQQLNEQHASAGETGWHLNMAALQLNPISGTGLACSAGDQHWVVLSKHGIRQVGSSLPRLGSDLDLAYLPGRFVLQPGEMLVSFSGRMFRSSVERDGEVRVGGGRGFEIPSEGTGLDMGKMFRFLLDWREEPAQDLANSVAEQLPLLDATDAEPGDRSFVVLKNLRSL